MLFGPEFLIGALPLTVMGWGCSCARRDGAGGAGAVDPGPALYDAARGRGRRVTLVVMNLLLVPPMGVMGAAIAAMLAQSVWFVAMWLTALRVVKVDVSILPRLRDFLHARRAAAARHRRRRREAAVRRPGRSGGGRPAR